MFNQAEAEKELIELDGKDPASSNEGVGLIDLDQASAVKLKERAAEQRATQYVVANQGSPAPVSYNEILTSIQEGTYSNLQEKLASEKALEQRNLRYQQVQDLVSSGQKLSTEQQDFIMGLSEEKFKNPMSIVEEEFSKTLHQFLTVRHTGEVDEDTHKVLDFAENQTAKIMVAQNQHQNALARYESMGNGDYYRGFNSWIPFYDWIATNAANRKNNAESSQEGIGTGSEIRAMVDQIWSIPDPGKMAQAYHDNFEELWSKSPDLAMKFSNAMQGYSNEQAASDNAWSAIDVVTTIPVVKGAKLIAKMGKGGKAVTVAPRSTEKTVQVIREGEIPQGSPQAGKAPVAPPNVLAGTKAVDRDGKPIRVFHGTDKVFDDFQTGTRTSNEGIYFSSDVKTADQYAQMNSSKPDYSGNVRPVYLIMKNPKVIEGPAPTLITKEAKEKLIKQGHDGIISKGGIYIVFDKSQIVSQFEPKLLSPGIAGLNGAAKVLAKSGADPVKVLDGAGLSKEAGKIDALNTIKTTDDLLRTASEYGENVPRTIAKDIERHNLEKLVKTTMTLANPGRFGSDIGTRSAEYARRLIDQMEAGQKTLQAVVGQSIKIARGTEAAYEAGFAQAEASLKKTFNKNMDTIQDIRRVAPEDSLSGVGYIEALVGRPTGGGFRTPLQAHSYATRTLGLKDQFLVEQSGVENFIRVRKNVDETSDAFRKALMSSDNISVKGKLPAILQWIRSPEDKFSAFIRGQRSTAVSGSQRVQALMRDRAKSIEGLSGTEKNNLERMMEINRDYLNPNDVSERGKFFSSVREYEEAYKKEFGNLPEEHEVDAYFAALQINDIDYVFRNLGIYRDKARMGYENITIALGPESRKTFEGKVIDNLPLDDGHPAGILVYAGPDDFVHVQKNSIKGEVRELLNKRITEEGWKVVQVMNPVEKTFGNMTDKSVNFLVTKSVQQAPLSFNQIPYRPGFHVAYKDEWFSKQGQFEVLEDGSKRRTGDVAVMSFSSQAKMNKFNKSMEEARVLMLKGDDEALRAHLEKHLPEEWDVDTFKAKFEETIDPKTGQVLKKARFQKDVPFVGVRSGQSVSDAGVILKDGKGFHELFDKVEDPLQSPYNDFSKVNKQFAGQRDPTLDALDEGSEANPVYRLDKSELVRPMDVLQNSMATIIRNRYFEDLQIVSAESYIEEFGDILLDSSGKAFSRNELRRNPVLALHEAQFDRKVDPLRVSQAKQIRAHTLNLLGTPSATSQHIQAYTDKLKNIAYHIMGERGVKLIPDRLIHTISDPFHYARAVAFHTKLGLFNPVQIFTQGQALAVTTAIAPKYATRSIGATAQMWRLSMTSNPGVINHMADLQTKIPGFGMKKEAFLDSYHWLKETGFDLVGQDHAWRGDIFEEKMFMGAGKRFLDKGAMFFNNTERFTRMNAWNTAYMEYVEKNVLKEGRVGPKDAKKILLRAKDLNVNMSRESNAIYQQGFMSSFTQFWGYQARLTDLMLGKRLKPQEKLQLIAGMGALYGVSGPANTLSPFYNVYDDIREEAMARGIDPNAGLMGYVMNGIPAMIYGSAFGDQPNFGERFGPSGFPIVKNIEKAFNDDSLPIWLSLLEQAGGAGTSITTDIVMDTVPFIGELLAIKDGKTTTNITAEAALDVLKNISSVSQAAKMYHALKTGEWTSANGAVLTDGISTPQAIFHGITGTQPQEIPDAFFMNDVANEYKSSGSRDELGNIIKEARTMMKKYVVARDSGDEGSAAVWSERLTILFNATGMTTNQKQKVLMQSVQGDTMVEAILKKFLKNGPPDELKARKETFGSKGAQ